MVGSIKRIFRKMTELVIIKKVYGLGDILSDLFSFLFFQREIYHIVFIISKILYYLEVLNFFLNFNLVQFYHQTFNFFQFMLCLRILFGYYMEWLRAIIWLTKNSDLSFFWLMWKKVLKFFSPFSSLL